MKKSEKIAAIIFSLTAATTMCIAVKLTLWKQDSTNNNTLFESVEPMASSTVYAKEEADTVIHGEEAYTVNIENDTARNNSVYDIQNETGGSEEIICTPQDVELLMYCVEAEAGNQSLYGRKLVADVVLNRVDDDDFPNTISEVIKQKYQFTTYWNGAIESKRISGVSGDTIDAVTSELINRTNSDVMYFTAGGYGNYGTPWAQVGDHYFSNK